MARLWALSLASLPAVGAGAVGFCLDNLPALLQGTGFYGKSSTGTQAACQLAGAQWCNLDDRIDTWSHAGAIVEYYYYSGCCSGHKGQRLIVDSASGRPTCASGKTPSMCTRTDWATKLRDDLLGDTSGYDFSVEPGGLPSQHNAASYPCVCAPTDARCTRTGKLKSGELICLVCETTEHCGPNPVNLEVNFFKVHTIDIRTSQLFISIWLRQSWKDQRLIFNQQCYGGIDRFVTMAARGTLENTQIWVPDLELYNSDEPLSETFVPQQAIVYGCEGPDSTSCGDVYIANTGVLKALCMYKGLVMFPYDTLSCELEIGGWSLSGVAQDLRIKGKGYQWVDDPNEDSLAGLTAGSTYQDYRIKSIEVKRMVTQYDCCPNTGWPTLLYKVDFKRSSSWYESKLVVPMVVLTGLSFTTFWMNPKIGERLGFGITAIVSMLVHDITASSMMPVCEERTFLNYLSLVCQAFCWFALVESAIVLFLHHQDVDTWSKVLVPKAIRMKFCASRLPHQKRASELIRDQHKVNSRSRASYRSTKESHEREQLFRRMFTELDRNYTGFLEPDELLYFGTFIMGSHFQKTEDLKFLRALDQGADSLHVSFLDFVNFCETKIAHMEDTDYLRRTTNSFVQVSRRRQELIRESWQGAARGVDTFSRFAVPLAYTIFLIVLWAQDFDNLEDKKEDLGKQIMLMATPIWPMLLVGLICLSVTLHYQIHLHRLKQNTAGLGKGIEIQRSTMPARSGTADDPPHDSDTRRSTEENRAGLTMYGTPSDVTQQRTNAY